MHSRNQPQRPTSHHSQGGPSRNGSYVNNGVQKPKSGKPNKKVDPTAMRMQAVHNAIREDLLQNGSVPEWRPSHLGHRESTSGSGSHNEPSGHHGEGPRGVHTPQMPVQHAAFAQKPYHPSHGQITPPPDHQTNHPTCVRFDDCWQQFL